MAVIFTDGFDKYGPNGIVYGSIAPVSLLLSEWTTSCYATIAAPLSSNGYALNFNGNSYNPLQMFKTLPYDMPRLIGGIRIKSDLSGGINQGGGIAFYDTNICQCMIRIDSGTGLISFIGFSGTTPVPITKTVTFSVKANSIHYLEWDITFNASGDYYIYMDSVLILSGSNVMNGGTGRNSINQFQLGTNGSIITYDDLYLFDDSGPTNNAVLLTNPRIETQFPIADSVKHFIDSQAILGNTMSTGTTDIEYIYNNSLNLIQMTPAVNMTVNSIICHPYGTPVDNWTAVVYSDLAGVPHTLLAQSADTIGTTSNTLQVDLLTPYAMSGGTPYWVGFMYKTDTSINTYAKINMVVTDTLLAGVYNNSVTYGGGPPSTAPSMNIAGHSFMFYAYCTGVASNWVSEERNPPPGDASYVYSSTPGDEDLYQFPALTTHPTAIYTVGVKSYARLTDTGNRTADLRMKSVTTDSSGSITGIIPTTSYEWIASFFDTDPATGLSWTESGLNSAVSGIKVAT